MLRFCCVLFCLFLFPIVHNDDDDDDDDDVDVG